MTLAELLVDVPWIRLDGPSDVAVSGLAYDSRQVRPGTVFCTWRGLAHDGHGYVPEALRRGAPAIVAEELVETAGVPRVLVSSGRRALARMAANFYQHPSRSLAVLGVTGTNGKTSVAWIVRQLFEKIGVRTGLLGTVAYDLGRGPEPAARTTPEGLDLQAALAAMCAHGCRAAAMEVSSHALAQGRTEGCSFAAAAFTNLTQDHLDFHGTMENYFQAKALLFTGLEPGSVAVINTDNGYGRRLLSLVPNGVRVVTCGSAFGADFLMTNLAVSAAGSSFALEVNGRSHLCETQLIGDFNASNITLALALACSLGHRLEDLVAALPQVRPVPGRLETVPASVPFSVVVDYAHTPDAVAQTLRVLRPLAQGRLIALLGCGGDRDRRKRPLMARAALEAADLVFFTSDNPRSEDPRAILADMAEGVSGFETARIELDRRGAIARALAAAAPGDIVAILGKGHEDYQEIQGEKHPFSDVQVARELLEAHG